MYIKEDYKENLISVLNNEFYFTKSHFSTKEVYWYDHLVPLKVFLPTSKIYYCFGIYISSYNNNNRPHTFSYEVNFLCVPPLKLNVINLRYSITKAKYNKLITESILTYPKFIWMHEGEGDCAFKDDMEMGTLQGGI